MHVQKYLMFQLKTLSTLNIVKDMGKGKLDELPRHDGLTLYSAVSDIYQSILQCDRLLQAVADTPGVSELSPSTITIHKSMFFLHKRLFDLLDSKGCWQLSTISGVVKDLLNLKQQLMSAGWNNVSQAHIVQLAPHRFLAGVLNQRVDITDIWMDTYLLYSKQDFQAVKSYLSVIAEPHKGIVSRRLLEYCSVREASGYFEHDGIKALLRPVDLISQWDGSMYLSFVRKNA